MSVASRVAAGQVSRAAWYYEHGYSIQALYDLWGAYAPGEDSRTLNAVWQMGVRASQAGELASQPGSQGNIPLGLIPGSTRAGSSFRYGVLATFQPSNGLAPQPVYFEVISPHQLNAGQLRDVASQNDPPTTSARRGSRSYGPADITWSLESVQVLHLERV